MTTETTEVGTEEIVDAAEDVVVDQDETTNLPDVESTAEVKEGEETEGETQEVLEPTGILKVKVNGEEKDFDLTDPKALEEVSKMISHSSAANKRMQEATQMQKQSMEFLKILKENPLEILTNPSLGINFREVAENYLIEQLNLDEMDEGTRTNYTKAKNYDRMVKQQEYDKQQNDTQAEQQAVANLRVQLTTEIENSIMESGMPLNDTTFGQVRALMLASAQQNTQLEAKDAVEQLTGFIKTMVEEGKDEDLVKILGEEGVKRVAKKKAPKENVVARDKQGETRKKTPSVAKKETVSDWRKRMGI